MNPLELFKEDRQRARAAEDPMVNLCTIATVDDDGRPQLRTLVLREVGTDMAIFVNATSPKWPHLGRNVLLHTYWPSVQVQYRMYVETAAIEPSIVHESWHLRPDAPKRLDWFYEQHSQQSATISSRDHLLEKLDQITLPDPMRVPDSARGLQLNPVEIERLDLTQANGVHDRRLFKLHDDEWSTYILVP